MVLGVVSVEVRRLPRRARADEAGGPTTVRQPLSSGPNFFGRPAAQLLLPRRHCCPTNCSPAATARAAPRPTITTAASIFSSPSSINNKQPLSADPNIEGRDERRSGREGEQQQQQQQQGESGGNDCGCGRVVVVGFAHTAFVPHTDCSSPRRELRGADSDSERGSDEHRANSPAIDPALLQKKAAHAVAVAAAGERAADRERQFRAAMAAWGGGPPPPPPPRPLSPSPRVAAAAASAMLPAAAVAVRGAVVRASVAAAAAGGKHHAPTRPPANACDYAAPLVFTLPPALPPQRKPERDDHSPRAQQRQPRSGGHRRRPRAAAAAATTRTTGALLRGAKEALTRFTLPVVAAAAASSEGVDEVGAKLDEAEERRTIDCHSCDADRDCRLGCEMPTPAPPSAPRVPLSARSPPTKAELAGRRVQRRMREDRAMMARLASCSSFRRREGAALAALPSPPSRAARETQSDAAPSRCGGIVARAVQHAADLLAASAALTAPAVEPKQLSRLQSRGDAPPSARGCDHTPHCPSPALRPASERRVQEKMHAFAIGMLRRAASHSITAPPGTADRAGLPGTCRPSFSGRHFLASCSNALGRTAESTLHDIVLPTLQYVHPPRPPRYGEDNCVHTSRSGGATRRLPRPPAEEGAAAAAEVAAICAVAREKRRAAAAAEAAKAAAAEES